MSRKKGQPQPKDMRRCWFVNANTKVTLLNWLGSAHDASLYRVGNLFNNYKAAFAAAKRIRQVLKESQEYKERHIDNNNKGN